MISQVLHVVLEFTLFYLPACQSMLDLPGGLDDRVTFAREVTPSLDKNIVGTLSNLFLCYRPTVTYTD